MYFKSTIALCILMVQFSLAQKNVLFITVDDLRPQLNAWLGDDFPGIVHPKMHTPHIDALAARSLVLKRAHVQQALCAPSRASALTGRRPDATRVYDLNAYWRESGGNFTTIPQYFKNNGYRSIGMSKIFHPGSSSGNHDPLSWTQAYWTPSNQGYWNNNTNSWVAATSAQIATHPLPDQQTTWHAIDLLEELAEDPEQPFFLAVGYLKPHLPFNFPEEFLDYYPEDDIRLPDNEYVPFDMPNIAHMSSGELRNYDDISALGFEGEVNETLPSENTIGLRRAMYGSISYIDSLIGELVAKVEEIGLAEETVIAFWGDHGFKVGEHAMWAKHSNYEIDTHAPMMIHVPGLTDDGIVSEELTEMVDLFPTIVEAAELPEIPLCPEDSSNIDVCTEGVSMMPLITDQDEVLWKDRAFSQYPKWADMQYMGYTMRTDRYHYTEWAGFSGVPDYIVDWEDNRGVELYDHEVDPAENRNLANDPEYVELVEELSVMLRGGWRDALPDI